MGLPPWSESPSQWFVLVTGTNGGVGFAICQRLIDEFLTDPSRDPLSHLVLIVSTRSLQKSHLVIKGLQKHLRFTTEKSSTAKYLRKHAEAQGRTYDWRDAVKRVHLLSVEIDLCNLRTVYEAAKKLKGENGGIGTPDIASVNGKPVDGNHGNGLKGIVIPRLDVVVLNAGIGGWLGIHWVSAVYHCLTDIKEAVTWWEDWKFPQPVAVAEQDLTSPGTDSDLEGGRDHLIDGKGHVEDVYKDQPKLGQIFCANVFGHYILSHELMPLLYSTDGRDSESRGRIIWITSVEGLDKSFSPDDIQGFKAENPYSSTKRLIDYLCLTYSLPSVRKISEPYFAIEDSTLPGSKRKTPRRASARYSDEAEKQPQGKKPEIYLLHPGICGTGIAGIHYILTFFMLASFYVARWVGSPWHPIKTYIGACGPVWAILARQRLLDTLEQFNGSYGEAKTKWGTATDFWGNPRVVKTETPGYGWTGRVGEDNVDEWVGTRMGRKRDTPDLTPELKADFEESGRQLWIQLEELRKEWEVRLGIRNGFEY